MEEGYNDKLEEIVPPTYYISQLSLTNQFCVVSFNEAVTTNSQLNT